jgi:AraC-like DNA-binding protein
MEAPRATPSTQGKQVMDQHTIANSMIHWTGARARGLDTTRILRRAGIAPQADSGPGSRVPRARYAALLRTLTRVMRDELWGLANHPVPPGTFACACWAAIHCATLREALSGGLAHYRSHLQDLSPRLHCIDGVAHVRLGASRAVASPHSHVAESTFIFYAIKSIWWLTGRRFPLRSVSFTHASSVSSGETSRLLRTQCLHLQPRAGFSFDAEWLDLPVSRDQDALSTFLRDAPDSLLRKPQAPPSIAARVRRHLREQCPGVAASLEQVARSLHMTETTLNRRLQQEGLHFQTIKDELRREASIRYLQHENLSLSAIADRLGFSEPAAFSRAFKRWTGFTPSVFRQEQAGAGLRELLVRPLQPAE